MTSEAAPPPLPAVQGPPAPHAPTTSLARAATLDILLAVALVVIASIAAIVPILVVGFAGDPALMGDSAAADRRMAELEPQVVIGAVFAMAAAALATWLIRRRSLSAPLPRMATRNALLLAVPAGIAIQLFALSMGVVVAGLGTEVEPSNAAPLEAMAQSQPWLMALLVVAVAPLAEELLFRHVLLRRFALHGRPLLGVFATSLLFAAMHEAWPGEQGVGAWLATLLLYTGMGAGFGWVYLRTGRLSAAMLAHAACNAAALWPMFASLA